MLPKKFNSHILICALCYKGLFINYLIQVGGEAVSKKYISDNSRGGGNGLAKYDNDGILRWRGCTYIDEIRQNV